MVVLQLSHCRSLDMIMTEWSVEVGDELRLRTLFVGGDGGVDDDACKETL